MCHNKTYPNDYLEKACVLFEAAKNVKKKDKYGIKPAIKNLAVLSKLDSIKTFSKMFKKLMLKSLPLPFSVSVYTDMKDTKKYCVGISGPKVILPDASYYKEEMASQKEMILGIWVNVAMIGNPAPTLVSKRNFTPLSNAVCFRRI